MTLRKSISYSALRSFVRSTHDWPVLGPTYRLIYEKAANSVTRLAGRNPHIAGVYARNSYALGDWEAGRSDIDLTVVWSDPRQDTIREFHASYAKLQERFPMLGEVEMIDELHLGAWSQYGFSGLHSREWKKLAGGHRWQCQYDGCESFDKVRHATAVYRYQFLKYLREDPRTLAAERSAGKLIRAVGGVPKNESSLERLMKTCLSELSRAVREVTVPSRGPLVDFERLIGEAQPSILPDGGGALSLDGVQSVIAWNGNPAHKHVVVDGDFDLAKIQEVYPGASVWSLDVFRFYLAFVDPLEYFLLLRERSICQGEDPLSDAFPVTAELLRDSVCHYAVDMLTYPYRGEVEKQSAGEFRNTLYGWYLRTLRYFEDGIFDFDYHTLRRYFGSRFPEDAPRFELLHSIAGELSAHLCAEVRNPV